MESVRTALSLLELVAEHGEVGVSELARQSGEPKTTVQRNLVTLHEAGWLRPVQKGRRRSWALSSKILTVARHVEPVADLQQLALPVMEDLRQKTAETIHLMQRDGKEVVLIERLDSPQALRTVRAIGLRAPLHVASNGKAVLAHLDPDQIEDYLSEKLVAWTPTSHTDPAKLRRHLKLVQKQGYAFNDGELDRDVRAIAAPVFDTNTAPIAALSISCPATRFPKSKIETYGRLVKDAAAKISRSIASGA